VSDTWWGKEWQSSEGITWANKVPFNAVEVNTPHNKIGSGTSVNVVKIRAMLPKKFNVTVINDNWPVLPARAFLAIWGTLLAANIPMVDVYYIIPFAINSSIIHRWVCDNHTCNKPNTYGGTAPEKRMALDTV
jgi:hypothetical protein